MSTPRLWREWRSPFSTVKTSKTGESVRGFCGHQARLLSASLLSTNGDYSCDRQRESERHSTFCVDNESRDSARICYIGTDNLKGPKRWQGISSRGSKVRGGSRLWKPRGNHNSNIRLQGISNVFKTRYTTSRLWQALQRTGAETRR